MRGEARGFWGDRRRRPRGWKLGREEEMQMVSKPRDRKNLQG
jgi:hypothetical protein